MANYKAKKPRWQRNRCMMCKPQKVKWTPVKDRMRFNQYRKTMKSLADHE